MFVGKVDGNVLFANTRPKEYGIISGTIDNQSNSAAQFNFTLPPTNIAKDLIIPAASTISVEQDGIEIFRGVLTERTIDNDGNYVCVAQDMISCLNNVLKEPFTITSKDIGVYITALIGNYNDAVTKYKKLVVGNIAVTGTFSVVHNKEYLSIFDLVKELIEAKGGCIRLRYTDGDVYIDYLADDTSKSEQEIVFGKNLIDISSQIDTATLISRVYPIGTDGLTISSVNNSKAYLINSDVEEMYGRIEKTISVNSSDAATVKSYGQAYLTRYAALSNTITLTAIDLSILNKSLNSFAVGDSVHIVSPPHGIDAYMPVTQIAIDVLSPGNSRITLGTKSKTLTDIV